MLYIVCCILYILFHILLNLMLQVFAYKSTKSSKTQYRRQDGDKFICVP